VNGVGASRRDGHVAGRAEVERGRARADDAVREGVIPKRKANDLGIIYSVWLDPSVLKVPAGEVDHEGLFRVNREATVKVNKKALAGEPKIDWLLKNQDEVEHYFDLLGIEGKKSV
jgi:5,6,7,8-tetrahydromethanopterin hydro-lyase